MTVSGSDLRIVFEPVLEEVLKLVKDQIKASPKTVKAVILVGGFGQNAYLRDTIRQTVEPYNIEVLQSPNRLVRFERVFSTEADRPYSWTAVVRGALMRGLASTSPASARVMISERSARKHYGICAGFEYLHGVHESSKKVWDGFFGFHRVYMMDWFVTKVRNPSKQISFSGDEANASFVIGQTSQGRQAHPPTLPREKIDIQRPSHGDQSGHLLLQQSP